MCEVRENEISLRK